MTTFCVPSGRPFNSVSATCVLLRGIGPEADIRVSDGGTPDAPAVQTSHDPTVSKARGMSAMPHRHSRRVRAADDDGRGHAASDRSGRTDRAPRRRGGTPRPRSRSRQQSRSPGERSSQVHEDVWHRRRDSSAYEHRAATASPPPQHVRTGKDSALRCASIVSVRGRTLDCPTASKHGALPDAAHHRRTACTPSRPSSLSIGGDRHQSERKSLSAHSSQSRHPRLVQSRLERRFGDAGYARVVELRRPPTCRFDR